MAAPARPIFQNGQRLTAEQLNNAFDNLRTQVRRLSLGPLSAGVGAGLELSFSGDPDNTVTVTAGIAIDGGGNMLVLTFDQTFAVSDIEASLSGPLPDASVVRVALVSSNSQPIDPTIGCIALQSQTIVENARVAFTRSDRPASQFFDAFDTAQHAAALTTSCVAPFGDLDAHSAEDETCGVTLGHIVFRSAVGTIASEIFRQGVAPEVGVLRNSRGSPAVYLSEMNVDVLECNNAFAQEGEPETSFLSGVDAVVVDHPTQFNQDVGIKGRAFFKGKSGGPDLQATKVGVYCSDKSAGTFLNEQEGSGVFQFSGGAADGVTDHGITGVAAVPLPFLPLDGDIPISRAGIPLEIVLPNTSTEPGDFGVHAFGQQLDDTNSDGAALLGLSAGQQTTVTINRDLSHDIVPVAVSGVVLVTLVSDSEDSDSQFFPMSQLGTVSVGDALTASRKQPGNVRLATEERPDNTLVLARALQNGQPGEQILAWVVPPIGRLVPLNF